MKHPYLPVVFWAIALWIGGPSFMNQYWELALVLFAAWVLAPLSLSSLGYNIHFGYFGSVALLSSGILFPFTGAFLLGLPYSGFIAYFLYQHIVRIRVQTSDRADFVYVFALGYWLTGAIWTLCWLANLAPMDFDSQLVSLTAAHFHLAGFVLTLLTGHIIRHVHPLNSRLLAGFAYLGMPLVALGITLTQRGFPSGLEYLAALIFAANTAWISWLQYQFDGKGVVYRRIGSGFLWLGILLAVAYALRFIPEVPHLSIYSMKYWHGSIQTFGFAWFSLIGWNRFFSAQKNTGYAEN